ALNGVVLATGAFDPYPFILLNLILSCLAAVQAPIIMMSQNRAEARDRLRAENDYKVNLKAELEIRHLHEKLDHLLRRQYNRLFEIQQIQVELLQEIGRLGIAAGDSQDILYSTDSGSSWQIGQSGFFGPPLFGAHMLSSMAGFVTGQNAVFQPWAGNTTDGGAGWDFHPFYFDKSEGGGTDVFFFDVNTGVVSGIVFNDQGAVARTTDGGT